VAFALSIAVLSSVFTASCVLIIQGVQSQLNDRKLRTQKSIGNLIEEIGQTITPTELAQKMQIPPIKAHKLLCSMVDDYYFTLQFDRHGGSYRFGFTERHRLMRTEQVLSDSTPAPNL
jgi:hypothetical protein